MHVSRAVKSMPRSGIREIMDLAWNTPDVIHLEVGEPDFPTPPHVCAAAAEAASAGITRYTPNTGIPALRAALADKIKVRNGYVVDPDHIVVTNGAVEGLYSSLLAILDPGDEVLLPDPGWPNFRMMADLLGARAVGYPLHAANGFIPHVPDLEELCTSRTRVLLLNTPSNPLGAVIPRGHIEALLSFAAERGLWVLSDECYDGIAFSDTFTSVAAVGGADRVISVYSFSKTYAMTGWRVGYVAAPEPLVEALSKVQEPIISCVNAPAQMAALAAVTGPQEDVEQMRLAYRRRRDEVVSLVESAHLPVVPPEGAFYVWVDIRRTGKSSRDFVRELITRRQVATVPGTAFGAHGEGYLRISLATSEELLMEGTRRLVDFAS